MEGVQALPGKGRDLRPFKPAQDGGSNDGPRSSSVDGGQRDGSAPGCPKKSVKSVLGHCASEASFVSAEGLFSKGWGARPMFAGAAIAASGFLLIRSMTRNA